MEVTRARSDRAFFCLRFGVHVSDTRDQAPHIIERICKNQLALEAAMMELTLFVESQGHAETGDNVHGALFTLGENDEHIKQGLTRLKTLEPD